MSTYGSTAAVMELSPQDRLELARRIVDSVVADEAAADEIAEAVRGIEDILAGKVRGLSEAEFQAELNQLPSLMTR